MINKYPLQMLAMFCVCVLPGCSNDGGVEASVAGQSHSDGDGPAHHPESVICKSLMQRQTLVQLLQFQLTHMHLVLNVISFSLFMVRSLTTATASLASIALTSRTA